jgi:hypothetical protein
MSSTRKISRPKSRRAPTSTHSPSNPNFQPNQPSDFSFGATNNHLPNPFNQQPQAPGPTWRKRESATYPNPEDDVPDDNPLVQPSYINPEDEGPNPFADLQHNHHPPATYFIRKLSNNVHPDDQVPDDNPLVSPSYSNAQYEQPQEPNPFGDLEWKQPDLNDEVAPLSNAVITIPPATAEILNAPSCVPIHITNPKALQLGIVASAMLTMPGAQRVTVGLALSDIQGVETVEAIWDAEKGALEIVVRKRVDGL